MTLGQWMTFNEELQGRISACLQRTYICIIYSGGTIRRELDFQTRVRVLASTSIPKKNRNHGRRFEWTIIEMLATMKE